MSRMCSACTSLNSNGAAISRSRASPRLSDARMAAMMASIMSRAFNSPSTMCALACARRRRYSDRRVTTSIWWADVGFQRRLQVERPRPAVDQRHHVDAETGLQRRQLVQVVEDDVGVGVPLERDDDLGVVAGREVLDVPDALELPAVDQFGDAFLDGPRAGLVRQFGHDDLSTVAGFFDRRPWPACGSNRGRSGKRR